MPSKKKSNKELITPADVDRALKITRDGMTDEKLVPILSDPNLTRDQKIVGVNAWLWHNGLENESILGELMLYKGKFGTENHKFKSQIRFDFTHFVGMFTTYLRDSASGTFHRLELGTRFGTLEQFKKDALGYVAQNKGKTLQDFMASKGYTPKSLELSIIEQMLRDDTEADLMDTKVKEVTIARERELGYGIFVDGKGKIFSIFDKDFDEAIEKEKKDNNV